MSNFDPHRYTITIKLVTLDEGDHYEAVVAELPDLVEYGETYDQAYSLAVESIEDLYDAAREQGRDFPAAMPSQALMEYSGRITLRMAKSLHASASRLADLDGVSLNSWIVEAVAARVGAGVSTSAFSNAYTAENIRAFKVLYLQWRSALTQPAAGSTWVPDLMVGNQILEFKGAPAAQLSTTAASAGSVITLQ